MDQFIFTYPANVQTILEKIRKNIHDLCRCSEKISYGIPTFVYQEKNLVHISAYAKHIGFYPGADAIKAFEKELSRYHCGKGSVQFRLDQEIPYELIKRIVIYRINEVDKHEL